MGSKSWLRAKHCASWLKGKLSPSMYSSMVRVGKTTAAFWYREDLDMLARIFGTDKCQGHWYTQHYQRYFAPVRKARLNLLEIGIGGYANSKMGGESLRMWKAYFRDSRIVGIDIEDKRHFTESRIDIRQCDQTDAESLKKLSEEYGGFDIIIDDGSHINEHVLATFHILFPILREGGLYVVEDVQTSYWPTWGGGLKAARTSMQFFKGLTDGLNHVEYPIEDYNPTYFDRNIVEIAFFHNLIMVRKGTYAETASAPKEVEWQIAAIEAAEAQVSDSSPK
jgi:hypothetical protein